MLCMQGWVRPEREMKGWDCGGRPDPLPDSEAVEKDTEPDAF